MSQRFDAIIIRTGWTTASRTACGGENVCRDHRAEIIRRHLRQYRLHADQDARRQCLWAPSMASPLTGRCVLTWREFRPEPLRFPPNPAAMSGRSTTFTERTQCSNARNRASAPVDGERFSRLHAYQRISVLSERPCCRGVVCHAPKHLGECRAIDAKSATN